MEKTIPERLRPIIARTPVDDCLTLTRASVVLQTLADEAYHPDYRARMQMLADYLQAMADDVQPAGLRRSVDGEL